MTNSNRYKAAPRVDYGGPDQSWVLVGIIKPGMFPVPDVFKHIKCWCGVNIYTKLIVWLFGTSSGIAGLETLRMFRRDIAFIDICINEYISFIWSGLLVLNFLRSIKLKLRLRRSNKERSNPWRLWSCLITKKNICRH